MKKETSTQQKEGNKIKHNVLRSLPSKHLKITSEGLTNGTWQINIAGIKDWDLHDTEVCVLALFGKKKKRQIS